MIARLEIQSVSSNFSETPNGILSEYKNEVICRVITLWHIQNMNENKNKTGTSKLGAIPKAQKAPSFYNMPKTFL